VDGMPLALGCRMLDFFHATLARAQAEDLFGGERPAAVSSASEASPLPPAYAPGVTGVAGPRALSPAAETVLDERELYLANSASFDARWAHDGLLARAMARHRGEAFADPATRPELGAPTSARPLRDPSAVIAEALASSRRPMSAPAPEREGPVSGLSPEEEYRDRRAAMDARAPQLEFLARALARHAARTAG